MGVYNVEGDEISTLFNLSAESLPQAYDVYGNELISGDYYEYDTEYEHTILLARDEWKTKYRADRTVVPIVISTDQHRYFKYAKSLYKYLAKAINWGEVSAHINLGDTNGSKYSKTDMDHMVSCLSVLPQNKIINIAGNHDVVTTGDPGSGYSYKALDDAAFTALQNNYYDNSGFGPNIKYGNRGNESIIDEKNHIKYVVITTWYYNEGGVPYNDPQLSPEAAEAWISMLSGTDSNDVIVLSHIEPYYNTNWYAPAVDGNEQSYGPHIMDRISKVLPLAQINQLIADRQTKSSGTLNDYNGGTHAYDFSECTSDILCCLAGHEHADFYQYSANGTVPVVIFDAMGYDYYPFFMVNVDRTNKLVDIWKIDQSPTFYNYQIPFVEEPINS